MKIEITPQTNVKFQVTGLHDFHLYLCEQFDTLAEARDYMDLCENSGYRCMKLELIAES